MACAEGAQLAAQYAQGPVIFETDCARVCKAMSSKEDRSDFSFVILEAKEHAQALDEWRVSQVKRECNLIAHELAQLARRESDSTIWLACVPRCVTDLVISDCNSIFA
jgi:hypothetical protein